MRMPRAGFPPDTGTVQVPKGARMSTLSQQQSTSAGLQVLGPKQSMLNE